ncbi:MAG: ABC transporter ATP-binding protein, partial [Clostridiales bacterium]|nr:ABC transporter ATP-binding protein [Clostridiales bacterium]
MAEQTKERSASGGPGEERGANFQRPKNARQTLGHILQYIGRSKGWLLLVFLFMLISTVCNITASYRLQPLIDETIFPNFDRSGLIRQLIILGLIYAGAALATYLQSRIMVRIAYRTTAKIRSDLFNHMQSLPLAYFDSKTHGELMSRYTNDIDNIQMMLEQSLVQVFSSAFTFIGVIIAMILLSPTLFAVTLAVLVVMLIASMQIGKRTRRYFQEQQSNLGKM